MSIGAVASVSDDHEAGGAGGGSSVFIRLAQRVMAMVAWLGRSLGGFSRAVLRDVLKEEFGFQ